MTGPPKSSEYGSRRSGFGDERESGRMNSPAAHLYLDLLKQVLTGMLSPAKYKPAPAAVLDAWPPALGDWLQDRDLALVSNIRFDPRDRAQGRDWPADSETMIGLERLNNLQHCLESVLQENVPGDFLEAGVWRGGASIFARAILKVFGVSDRTVWLADSFQGVPKPDASRYEKDAGDLLWTAPELAVPLDTVKANFQRYGLLDRQVAFVPGWFRDTLPGAPVGPLAVLRLDGDLYESTMIALRSLYPKLSVGGYLIVDDYGAREDCREAVHDFRTEFDIREQIVPVDWTGVYWRVERTIPAVREILTPPRAPEDAHRSLMP
ncbi:MAG: TylF/MycF family methyltransferase [Acidobacteriota bacterium]|nr:TylF/MycF family methyltransferase [Acidobacteriota bacterium]